MTVRRRFVALAGLFLTLAACQREELLSVDPGEAPGEAAPTAEAVLGPAELGAWLDTVFPGFARPAISPFLLIEEGTGRLTSRGLLRFDNVADSVLAFDTLSAAVRYDSARLVLAVDTLRTRLAAGGTTLRLLVLEQEWDARSATWELAVDSGGTRVPWVSGPGGALGQSLAEAVVDEESDSVVFDLGALSDSILQAWTDTTQVNSGLALAVADSGRLSVGPPALRYLAVPEVEPDTALPFSTGAVRTYIFDRASPPVAAGVLRVGGVDGWRTFAELNLPDSATAAASGERFRLRGAAVSKAELVLVSRAPPAEPFRAEQPFFGVVFRLVDDFRVFGPKTPVGDAIAASVTQVQPDSLSSGSSLGMDITRRIQDWAVIPADSTPPPVRLVIRAADEAANFGYWEFGAADGDPAFIPQLRIVFTPATEFSLP